MWKKLLICLSVLTGFKMIDYLYFNYQAVLFAIWTKATAGKNTTVYADRSSAVDEKLSLTAEIIVTPSLFWLMKKTRWMCEIWPGPKGDDSTKTDKFLLNKDRVGNYIRDEFSRSRLNKERKKG